jgi:hypothetical protein
MCSASKDYHGSQLYVNIFHCNKLQKHSASEKSTQNTRVKTVISAETECVFIAAATLFVYPWASNMFGSSNNFTKYMYSSVDFSYCATFLQRQIMKDITVYNIQIIWTSGNSNFTLNAT